LFVRGGKSDYIIEKDYEFMKHHFPNYEMVTLEESGHWIHVDDPEGFNKATEEFFCNK
jgi:pimeloyl-ACP methyl ester carboxylesterase